MVRSSKTTNTPQAQAIWTIAMVFSVSPLNILKVFITTTSQQSFPSSHANSEAHPTQASIAPHQAKADAAAPVDKVDRAVAWAAPAVREAAWVRAWADPRKAAKVADRAADLQA